jgi:undecaprenyl-diphosphatase
MEEVKKLNIEKPEHRKLFSAELIAVTGLSAISVLGFARITTKLVKNNLNPFRTDIKIINFLSKLRSPKLTGFMKFISSLSSLQVLPFIAGSLTVLFFKSKHNKTKSFDIPVIAVGSALLNLIFKARFKRNRPIHDQINVSGWSYPSGHAMESMSFYGLMIYSLFRSKLSKPIIYTGSALLWILILLIGTSRSYLRVHYPSDVAAGYALGLLWLVGSISMIRGIEYFLRKKSNNEDGYQLEIVFK